ncbi:NAD-dependent DNA ligase [Bacillus toyonensis]|uniref:NAD-dependent DNA ligase n=1 Tax=Bacillus toyonensis TaxID=155322 RepID=UPI000BF6F211|nr:NAD-dependent DNA ligase [Bacillus toyonensis]PGF05228.1 NAD-dependent DNA ligase [Bacillus toyonensis]
MLVSEMKHTEGYQFNELTLALVPNNCFSCGSPLKINPVLTHLTCSNPRCIDKITLRTVAMFTQLGVVDIGEPTIKKLIRIFGIDCPLIFFCYEPSDWQSVSYENYNESLKRKIDDVYGQLANKRDMTLTQFIQIANLPNVQTSADKLFEDITTLDEFYEQLESGGVAYIQKKLGIQRENSLKSYKLYETFMEYKKDLQSILSTGFINIIADTRADIRIKAVCTDEVGAPFRKKAEFYTYMDENFGDKIYIDWGKSATKSMDVLIWAGADGTPARYTNKVQKAENWNEQGEGIPILTANQFIEIVQGSANGQSVLDTLESLG